MLIHHLRAQILQIFLCFFFCFFVFWHGWNSSTAPPFVLLDTSEKRFSQSEESVVRIKWFVTKATVRGTMGKALSGICYFCFLWPQIDTQITVAEICTPGAYLLASFVNSLSGGATHLKHSSSILQNIHLRLRKELYFCVLTKRGIFTSLHNSK